MAGAGVETSIVSGASPSWFHCEELDFSDY